MDKSKIASELVTAAREIMAFSVEKRFAIGSAGYCSLYWDYVFTYDKTAAEMVKYSATLSKTANKDMAGIRMMMKRNYAEIDVRMGFEPTLGRAANGNLPKFGMMASFKVPEGGEDTLLALLKRHKFRG